MPTESRPSAFSWRNLRPRHYALAAGVLLLLLGLLWLERHIDLEALHARARAMNGPAVFVAITFLPLLGFPVSVLHAIAGARFGMGWGLVWVGVSIFIQMVLSYAVVRLMPGFFARKFEPLRRRLPVGAHRAVTLFTFLLPGAPYFAQNYVLPLIGVPLGTYLGWGVTIHFLRSAVGVVFGHATEDLTPLRLAGFAAYTVAIVTLCGWAYRRLRREMQFPPPAEDGPKRPA